MSRAAVGSTLAEVVVAALLLQVGLLATAGMLVTAADSLRDAERREAATRLAREVADSLARVASPAPGTSRRGGLEAEWSVEGAGVVRIEVREGVDGAVRARLLSRPPRPW